MILALFGAITSSVDIRLVDSGASRHMTGYKSALTNLKEKKFFVEVELGDNATYEIKGVGSASFQLNCGGLHIEEILLVPGLKKNLISIVVLEDKGFRVTFTDGKALLCPKDKDLSSTIVIGIRERGLYKVLGHSIQALVREEANPSELWHLRFGHLHYRALLSLQKMVTGMPVLHFEHNGICRGCSIGKYTKRTFPNNDKRSKGILDLIHLDICGPMTAPSMSGCSYYVIFIDDFS